MSKSDNEKEPLLGEQGSSDSEIGQPSIQLPIAIPNQLRQIESCCPNTSYVVFYGLGAVNAIFSFNVLLFLGYNGAKALHIADKNDNRSVSGWLMAVSGTITTAAFGLPFSASTFAKAFTGAMLPPDRYTWLPLLIVFPTGWSNGFFAWTVTPEYATSNTPQPMRWLANGREVCIASSVLAPCFANWNFLRSFEIELLTLHRFYLGNGAPNRRLVAHKLDMLAMNTRVNTRLAKAVNAIWKSYQSDHDDKQLLRSLLNLFDDEDYNLLDIGFESKVAKTRFVVKLLFGVVGLLTVKFQYGVGKVAGQAAGRVFALNIVNAIAGWFGHHNALSPEAPSEVFGYIGAVANMFAQGGIAWRAWREIASRLFDQVYLASKHRWSDDSWKMFGFEAICSVAFAIFSFSNGAINFDLDLKHGSGQFGWASLTLVGTVIQSLFGFMNALTVTGYHPGKQMALNLGDYSISKLPLLANSDIPDDTILGEADTTGSCLSNSCFSRCFMPPNAGNA